LKLRSYLIQVFCCLYFLGAGFVLIPYPGFQHDEVLFAEPIFQRGLTFYSYAIGRHNIPLMLMSYLGTLKTLIYWPIFKNWHPSAYSLRVPVLLISAFSLLLFWPVMRRAGGRRAAAIAAVVLATDSMYLLTSLFDWGPVALQHLFLVSILLALIRYHETGKSGMLALACFVAGLALWDKALFFWIAGGLVVGGLASFPRQIWRRVHWRSALVAAISFFVGAAPLILYNVHRRNATLGQNVNLTLDGLESKAMGAERSLDGQALFGYIVFDDWVAPPREPRNGLETASLRLRGATGANQRNVMLWAYGLSLLIAPFAWRTRAWRPMLFALIFSLTTWVLMLITKGAGSSVHHVILIWPVPVMFLALSWSEASRKIPHRFATCALVMFVGVLAVKNVLVTNQYLAQFIRNGPTPNWTNALYPLSSAVVEEKYGEIDGIDWATVVPLRIRERGRVPLDYVDVNNPGQALSKMGRDGVLFLGHVKAWEVLPGVDEQMDAIATSHGFTKQLVRTFDDENGRPIFELFQYRR
jgi:hypothetical protein